MEIFAAGNKYKLLDGKEPNLIHGYYYVYARRWVKSKQEYSNSFQTYNVGPNFTEVK
jgi:hypothetical protein